MKLKAVSLAILTLLLTGMLTLTLYIQTVKSQDSPIISVNPLNSTVQSGASFTIEVNVTNITDLGCWQFMLSYNTTILDAICVSATPCTENNHSWLPVDTEGIFHPDGPPTIDDTIGRVWVAALFPMSQPFTGSGALITINFTAAAPRNCTLHLYNTVLGDHLGEPISHRTLDGSVTVLRSWGDVDGNGRIDILDVKKVKLAYSGIIVEPFADLDDNGVIDILDVKKIKLIYSGLL